MANETVTIFLTDYELKFLDKLRKKLSRNMFLESLFKKELEKDFEFTYREGFKWGKTHRKEKKKYSILDFENNYKGYGIGGFHIGYNDGHSGNKSRYGLLIGKKNNGK